MIDDTEVERLLPCPFCGGVPKRITLGADAGPDNEGGDVIVCTGKCGCSSHVEFGFKENLVSLWNERTFLAASPAPRMVGDAMRLQSGAVGGDSDF